MGTFRKILTTGVGAALMTESGLRQALSDIQLTRQARDYISRQASKGKEEITKVLAAELKRFLERVNLHDEIQKALSGMKLEVSATVTLVPTDSARNPTKFTVRKLKVKRV